MNYTTPGPRVLIALLAFLASCGSGAMQENRHVTPADPLPEILAPDKTVGPTELDLAAPAEFGTATFALG